MLAILHKRDNIRDNSNGDRIVHSIYHLINKGRVFEIKTRLNTKLLVEFRAAKIRRAAKQDDIVLGFRKAELDSMLAEYAGLEEDNTGVTADDSGAAFDSTDSA